MKILDQNMFRLSKLGQEVCSTNNLFLTGQNVIWHKLPHAKEAFMIGFASDSLWQKASAHPDFNNDTKY